MSEQDRPKRYMPIARLTGAQVVGTGSYLPDQVVKNEDLQTTGADPDWIFRRTGIRERRHAPPEMATSDMAVLAAERCIADAGVDRRDIDLLILATFTPDYLLPPTCNVVQDRLGLTCGAIDVMAACAGYLYSLTTAMQYVVTGCSRLALVIGSDVSSRGMDPEDRHTYPLFGDGAGATLVARGNDDQGWLAYMLGSDGSGEQLLVRPAGGSRMPLKPEHVVNGQQHVVMEGGAVFRWAVRLLDAVFPPLLDTAGVALADVDLWVPHQANARIIDAAAASLGIDPKKLVMHLERYGNMSSASIPVALDEAIRAGQIRRGMTIATAGFGAGLTWAAGVFKW